ncbi:hypothetical protein [Rubrimonas cliftonensis]|uniref:Ca-activated chloride channel family protein n=1 Tax=Rubrimonas cliftonensis TaxID=89524 RepID=A0A1H4E476_9RHOB|nr:hypothetical protein [Rubrimonas cliftonensis]SEA79579.1 Ca-activated chloride channel family protein [Rubrimonas cliftonensis]
MRLAAGLFAAAAALAGAALAVGGGDAPARLALALGAPGAAAALAGDPFLEGRARFAARDWEGAAAAFRVAGPRASYNRAAALALSGDYELSLASYDAVLARTPDDLRAAENRAVVASVWRGARGDILPGVEGAGDGSGDPENVSPYDEAVSADGGAAREFEQARSELAAVVALGREQVRRMPDAKGRRADRLWLETFPDAPAAYLKAAIRAEQARRAEAGLAPPEPADPR